MQFVDLAKVIVRSGSGGNGAISFRREKFVEFGGPDGGNGGRGGSVFVEAVSNLNTLVDFRYRRHVNAGDGRAGRGKMCTGAKGKDAIIYVPVGTEILDENCESLVFDLVDGNGRKLLLPGGNGGFGNSHFKSSVNQAPRIANKGQPGIERTFWFRLKILADAGLVGLPNAGKSTFLSVVSNAKPKIADHPFTTLYPMLGVVSNEGTEFVIADIPGLIEGAHEGKGLGDVFLGHVERCRVLLCLIDCTSEAIADDFRAVVNELNSYGKGLADKPRITILTKTDLLASNLLEERIAELKQVCRDSIIAVSAVAGTGITGCLRHVAAEISNAGPKADNGECAVPWTP